MQNQEEVIKVKRQRYDLFLGYIDYNQYDEDKIYKDIQKYNRQNLKTTRERTTYLIQQLLWQIYMIDHIDIIKELNPKKNEDKEKMEKMFKEFQEN